MEETWLLDSGASYHTIYHREYVQIYHERHDGSTIFLGDNGECAVVGEGTIIAERLLDDKWSEVIINNVLYVPGIKKNLLSAGLCTSKGLIVTLQGDHARIANNKGATIVIGEKLTNNLFKLFMRAKPIDQPTVAVATFNVWHGRLAHVNCDTIKKVVDQGLVEGVKIQGKKESFFCEPCQLGKAHKLPFYSSKQVKTQPGEFFHSDLFGPMSVQSLGGSKYTLMFTDNSTSYKFAYFVKYKSDVFDKFKIFERLVANKFEKPMKRIRYDGGGEYVNRKMEEYMQSIGIKYEKSAPRTPEQNGKSERQNRTVIECARTLLQASEVPKYLWAEAVNCVIYVLNRVLSPPNNPNCTSYELWTGEKPNLSHLKVFGVIAYKVLPKQFIKKLDAVSEKVIFVGYEGDSPNYRLYSPSKRTISVAKHVTFDETNIKYIKDTVPEEFIYLPPIEKDSDHSDSEEEESFVDAREDALSIASDTSDQDSSEDPQEDNIDVEEELQPVHQNAENVQPKRLLRDRATLQRPARYQVNLALSNGPKTYEEATTCSDAAQWLIAINEELTALDKHHAWTYIKKEPGMKPLDSIWVFKAITGEDGQVERYRTRLCAKGCQQEFGVDYTETFSPVVRYDSIRVLLARVAHQDQELKSFDVCSAFLYGDFEDEVLMEVPLGVTINGVINKKRKHKSVVCKLIKSLYGLKQAPRCWNSKFVKFLKRFGFKENKGDKCVFFAIIDGFIVLLAIFVDNGIIICKCIAIINRILKSFEEEFDITVENATSFVGFQIVRDRENKSLFIHQAKYVNHVLERFDMCNAKAVSVPADPNVTLFPAENVNKQSTYPYRQAVGSLLYLAMVTRPDIAYAVSILSRFFNKFDNNHVRAVKRVFAYLAGTIHVGIKYKSGGSNPNLIGFSDSHFATDLETRRSRTGYVFMLANGPVTWTSQRQPVVALSTTEAEYIAGAIAAKELMWLRKLVSGVGYKCEKSITLCIDNESAIKLAKNPEFYKRPKHIDNSFHYLREKCVNGDIHVEKVCSKLQKADTFTKALPRDRFYFLCDLLNIVEK